VTGGRFELARIDSEERHALSILAGHVGRSQMVLGADLPPEHRLPAGVFIAAMARLT
jgi:hypothetical protein